MEDWPIFFSFILGSRARNFQTVAALERQSRRNWGVNGDSWFVYIFPIFQFKKKKTLEVITLKIFRPLPTHDVLCIGAYLSKGNIIDINFDFPRGHFHFGHFLSNSYSGVAEGEAERAMHRGPRPEAPKNFCLIVMKS